MVDKEVIGYHTIQNGTILFRGRVCVPEKDNLRNEVLAQAHQSWFSIHPWKGEDVPGPEEILQLGTNEKGCEQMDFSVSDMSTSEG